jgi:tripeptidyl-peptidase-1
VRLSDILLPFFSPTQSEVAVGFSGGGFSDYFERPSYQQAAVSAYLNSGKLPNSKFYNSTSRAYPDIAAFATNFEVVIAGSLQPVDGTSCAAPTASAIFSLLNDARLLAGKSTLGFLNPLLYSITTPDALKDITDGNNGSGCCPGFDAAPGWDPVTGLGTPNYAILKEVVLALP